MNNLHLWSFFSLLIYIHTCPYITAQTPQLLGFGQHSDIAISTSNTQPGTAGENTISNEGYMPNDNASSRFLQQASFGPTYQEITNLSSEGFEDWIDQQFATPKAFGALAKVNELTAARNAVIMDPEDDGPISEFWDYAFWEYTLTSDDVLRQRIAYALSQILVISENSGFAESTNIFAHYYDILTDNAFGNYRDLLEEVTFTPAMGMYLTYMNNPRYDTLYEIDWNVWPPDTISQQIIFPDENYAREIMQLFTIGLCELNLDGTCKTDQNGLPIPTYDNVDIAELSKIFTGLTWVTPWCEFGCGSEDYDNDVILPMVMNNDYHDPGTKQLLHGHIVQPRNPIDGVADINEALDNLFNHPNVGPFIGKLLIQRLVTSNPSPGYVARVAKAFNGESHYGNQRGDMRAVIKAILLDNEARNCASQQDETFGRLREPFVRYLQICRTFNLNSPNNVYRNALETIKEQFGQKIFNSPSVFNFFQYDYQPIGPIEVANKFAPEFQITNAQSIAGYMNSMHNGIVMDYWVDDWGPGYEIPDDPGDYVSLNLSAEFPLWADAKLPELLDRLDLILAHGQLTQRTKDVIINTIKEMPSEGWNEDDSIFLREMRVRMAIFYVMTCPEYLVNR